MSAACPYRCTGRIARVRGPIARATCSGSIVSRDGSMSANTGRAPTIITASAVYAADNGVVMTSSPGPMPSRPQDERDRVGAGSDADGVGCAARRGKLRFERLDLRAEHEPAARDDAIDGLAHLACGVALRRQREERNPRPSPRLLRGSSTYWEKCWR